jgi:hypothetical protein
MLGLLDKTSTRLEEMPVLQSMPTTSARHRFSAVEAAADVVQ